MYCLQKLHVKARSRSVIEHISLCVNTEPQSLLRELLTARFRIVPKQKKRTMNTDYQNKRLFQQHFHQIINNNTDQFDPYFVTFTFKNTHQKQPYDSYRDYFRFFYRRLNQFTLSSSKQHHTRSILIAVPELSFQCTDKHMHAATHFHSLMLIHHKNRNRFKRRCVFKIKDDNSILLHPHLRNPYPTAIKYDQRKPALTTDSVHAIKLNSLDDIKYTSFYSTQNFKRNDFEYDQILFFTRSKRINTCTDNERRKPDDTVH